jgi:CubicO group peptidase (beta-lactamase class C family)
MAALIASAQPPPPVSPVKPEANAAKELQAYFDSLATENKISGVLLVSKDGVTIASRAAGVANKATGAPIDLNTKFNLGSMNKMFTSVAIAQLPKPANFRSPTPSASIYPIIQTRKSPTR